jgi:hypothetical protein
MELYEDGFKIRVIWKWPLSFERNFPTEREWVYNFANASMTENGTFFGQKVHCLVVEIWTPIGNQKNFVTYLHLMTENGTFFGQKVHSLVVEIWTPIGNQKKVFSNFQKKIVTYLHLMTENGTFFGQKVHSLVVDIWTPIGNLQILFQIFKKNWLVQCVHFFCPQWHELRPQRLQEDLLFHFKKGMVCQF